MATKPTSSKPTSSKPATSKPATPKTPKPPGQPRANATKTANPKAVMAGQVAPNDGGPEAEDGAANAASGMRLKDLVEHVAASSGFKKKDVKAVLDAALMKMAAALKQGENLNLAGLGRIRVARAAAGDGGAMTLKLRMAGPGGGPGGGLGEKAGKPGAAPLADGDDQD